MLDLLLIFAVNTRLLHLIQFDEIVDRFGSDLPAVLDDVHFSAPHENPKHVASGAMAERLVPRLLPIADALVAEATENSLEGMGEMVRAATALKIVTQLFPAASVTESLQAAVAHATGRIVLQSSASTVGMSAN